MTRFRSLGFKEMAALWSSGPAHGGGGPSCAPPRAWVYGSGGCSGCSGMVAMPMTVSGVQFGEWTLGRAGACDNQRGAIR